VLAGAADDNVGLFHACNRARFLKGHCNSV
jgi:hypothetical protein